MLTEWIIHNVLFRFGLFTESTEHVDLDNNDEGKELGDFVWDRAIKPILFS